MKRFLCGILALLAVFICAACSAAMQTTDDPAPQSTAAPAPQSTDAGGPVSVTETHADRDTVAVRPAPSTAPADTAQAEQTPTPATGEVPVVPLVGALGLILICAAGLVLLKRF